VSRPTGLDSHRQLDEPLRNEVGLSQMAGGNLRATDVERTPLAAGHWTLVGIQHVKDALLDR
jgi:hypothetical protein